MKKLSLIFVSLLALDLFGASMKFSLCRVLTRKANLALLEGTFSLAQEIFLAYEETAVPFEPLEDSVDSDLVGLFTTRVTNLSIHRWDDLPPFLIEWPTAGEVTAWGILSEPEKAELVDMLADHLRPEAMGHDRALGARLRAIAEKAPVGLSSRNIVTFAESVGNMDYRVPTLALAASLAEIGCPVDNIQILVDKNALALMYRTARSSNWRFVEIGMHRPHGTLGDSLRSTPATAQSSDDSQTMFREKYSVTEINRTFLIPVSE
jgi:hypothetical protein